MAIRHDDGSWTVQGERLTFPVRVALLSVTATSADAATVITGDGRTFATSDRGKTWLPR